MWLRDNCACPHCTHPVTREQRIDLLDIPDEIAAEAVDVVHPIRDVHVTMMQLLGLDDNKLTYFHAGRYKQLSQFGGELIPELIA